LVRGIRQKIGVQPVIDPRAVADLVPGLEELRAPRVGGVGPALRSGVIERVATGLIDLPLLPEVASQVVLLAGDPNADAAQLSAMIHRDPALAGHVLRIANSPAYMPRMPIVSLQQAIARLGLSLVTEIAFAASVQSGTFRVPGYEAELRQLWRHAIASAAFAKEIARLRRSNVESAFLCGLLHAVGKPALLQVVSDVEKAIAHAAPLVANDAAAAQAQRQVVAALLVELHAGVGGRIAELWGLPRQVAIAIGYCDHPEDAPAFAPDALITCLADRLATDLIDVGRFDEETLRDHRVFAELNLYPDDVASLRAKRASVAEVVESMTV
jgi:HD-like signal output (HDOD) protein